MKTGMVILNYNDSENTKKMLNQVKDYECLDKIIVVDNCSTDNSLEELKKYETKKVIILENKKNKGYAHGNNLGLKYLEENTKCDLAIVSNPDIVVSESVIKELINDFKEDEHISFLGPKILENGFINRGWKCPNFFTDLISNITFFHRLSNKMLKYPKEYYNQALTKVEVIHGCFMMGRIKDFKKVNYFDTHTFLYYEENILAKKAMIKNLETYVDNRVAVKHNLSLSVDKSLNKVKKYKILKNSEFYYEREYNHLNKVGMFFLKLFYYLSLGIAYLTFWI